LLKKQCLSKRETTNNEKLNIEQNMIYFDSNNLKNYNTLLTKMRMR